MFTIRNHKLSTKNQNLKTKRGKKFKKRINKGPQEKKLSKSKNEEKRNPQTKTTKSKTALNLIWGGSG